jgi:hypothetical protein
VTFSGRHSRPLSYLPYEREILAFSAQLFPLWFDMTTVDTNTWHREKASRHHLIEGVKLQNPAPDDLVMVSDCDEIAQPSAIRELMARPPKSYVVMRAHYFFYSLRYEGQNVWIKNGVVRYGAVDRPFGFYRGINGPVLPGFHAVHCSYCFGSIREIVRKLETFPHFEYSHGKYVDPNYILARVACGQSLFETKGGIFDLRPVNTHELDLPPAARFMGWRLPFTDLDKVEIHLTQVYAWADCKLNLALIDGKVQPTSEVNVIRLPTLTKCRDRLGYPWSRRIG